MLIVTVLLIYSFVRRHFWNVLRLRSSLNRYFRQYVPLSTELVLYENRTICTPELWNHIFTNYEWIQIKWAHTSSFLTILITFSAQTLNRHRETMKAHSRIQIIELLTASGHRFEHICHSPTPKQLEKSASRLNGSDLLTLHII